MGREDVRYILSRAGILVSEEDVKTDNQHMETESPKPIEDVASRR